MLLLLFLVLGVLIGAVIIVRMSAAKKNNYVLIRNVKYKQLNRPDGKLDYSVLREGIGVDE